MAVQPVATTAAVSRALPSVGELANSRWPGQVREIATDHPGYSRLECRREVVREVCDWLARQMGYAFATIIAEELTGREITLIYAFYGDAGSAWVYVEVRLGAETSVPSISVSIYAADWHERELEDLFGLHFEGHPRLGEFVLHEDWPEGVNPMRRDFDPRRLLGFPELDAVWRAPTIVVAPGAFAMPIGPVFSDFAESAHFELETVGEDVIHTIPRFFYKYRGVEKIVEGRSAEDALLVAERFSGTSALAHGLGFCQAIEAIMGLQVPPRARALRTIFAELERLRHHAAAITAICNSTALAVATSQAALIEEDLLRLSCVVGGHRYLFGVVAPGGVTRDLSDEQRGLLEGSATTANGKLQELREMLRVSSSFLDRLEEVGAITTERALAYALVGPIARASGVSRDIRVLFPYAGYDAVDFVVPTEVQGDGYARLRILFREAEQSASVIRQALAALPSGAIVAPVGRWRAGVALAAVEAPLGAAFHWVRLNETGRVTRYRVTPPSFTNWQGFHLAAENFAFQDFPIILASFGLSNAENDR